MALQSILIVGCGNMGGAMLAGWLAGGMEPGRFTVVDPVLPQVPAGVTLLRALPDRRFDALLLGVKPQLLGDVAPQLRALVRADTVLLSILAGVELDSLALLFPDAGGLLRIMPNLAAAIGKSPIALAGRGLDESDRSEISALMAHLGTPEWLASETLFDAVTALTGSGPAFVYRFIDSLAAAATGLGLPADQSGRLALAMVEGAAQLAATSPHSPGELADRVASPGGTTRAGLDVLDADQAIARLAAATLKAAADRSAEMTAEAKARTAN